MNDLQVNKMFKMVKKAISVPLMDVYNISTLIMDFTICPNKHFEFKYHVFFFLFFLFRILKEIEMPEYQ